MGRPADLLRVWLRRQLADSAGAWLEEQLSKLAAAPSDHIPHVTLGLIPRRLGKHHLALQASDAKAAGDARPGWDPRGWSVDVAARVLVLCELGANNPLFAEVFKELCRTAEIGELIAFYRGLPLYPEPERLAEQAGEGLRSNMRAVFEAVAHRNPYPREHFDDNRWNQMVVKALFIGSALHPIQGLDERANRELAQIMCDYAHERWAAGRPVMPELWRCVGPFAKGTMLDDLAKALGSDDEDEKKAAALALSANASPRARKILGSAGRYIAEIDGGRLSWGSLVPGPP